MTDNETPPLLNLRSPKPGLKQSENSQGSSGNGYDGKNRRVSKKSIALKIFTVFAAIAAVFLAGYFYNGHFSKAAKQIDQQAVQGTSVDKQGDQSFYNEDPQLEFSYKSPLIAQQLSDDDKKAGFIARLTAQDPPLIVSVRKETDLSKSAALSRIDVPTLLKNNIDKALPQRYPEFEQKSSKTVTIEGKTVYDRVFTYKGPSGAKAEQHMLAIVVDGDTAIYVSMQAPESQYQTVEDQYFTPLKESLKL